MADLPQKHDYSNSNKSKQAPVAKKKAPVEPVVVSEVIVVKKTLGQKFKDTFLDKDFFIGMAKGVYRNRVLPNAKNMLFDTGMEVLKQSVYRNGDPRAIFDPKSLATRFSYSTPVQRSMPYPGTQQMLPPGPRSQAQQTVRRYGGMYGDNYHIPTLPEAKLVLETMVDILEQHDFVTVQDFQELLRVEIDPLGPMWGWTDLRTVKVEQSRNGFYINLPPPQALDLR